jgi:5-oxoprolinase (ATP-hydrolysing) subunit A
MKRVVDLNADLGEGLGNDSQLLGLVTSANIATGFHAGDADSMRIAIETAQANGVAVGAHPSLFDRENFGRKETNATGSEVFDAVVYQLGVFQAIAERAGVTPKHVKPHGALYNMAARQAELADAIARAIREIDPELMLFAPPESELSKAGEEQQLQVVAEFFADRNYLADGALVPRTRPDALLADPAAAAVRVLQMLAQGRIRAVDGTEIALRCQTICVHGDTPGAVEFARSLREELEKNRVEVKAPSRPQRD